MSDVAETVVAQEPEVVEPVEEKPTETGSDDVVVIDEKTSEQNGEKTEETQAEATEEKNETEAEEADKDKAVENGEAKDTNGNDRKRVSSAHEKAPVADAEEDAPLTKKSKVEDEVDVAASGDAPAVAAE